MVVALLLLGSSFRIAEADSPAVLAAGSTCAPPLPGTCAACLHRVLSASIAYGHIPCGEPANFRALPGACAFACEL